MTLDLHAATSKPRQFVASGSIPSGTRWKLVGLIKDGEGDSSGHTVYVFTVTYAARLWPRRFTGTLSDNGRVFSGSWTCTSDNESGNFYLKRLTCDAMRFWPRSLELQRQRARALWSFALLAIRDQVQRQLLAKSRLAERQTIRQHYLQFIRSEGRYESDEEIERMRNCYLSMTPSEARYYHMIYEYRQRLAPKH